MVNSMKFPAFALDANNRSTWGEVEIPMTERTPGRATTAEQEAIYWGIAHNQPGEPINGGAEEMHLTNSPRIVWVMSGQLENTLQSGEIRRFGVGEGMYVDGRALHHSSFATSREPVITLNVTFPGIENYAFKK